MYLILDVGASGNSVKRLSNVPPIIQQQFNFIQREHGSKMGHINFQKGPVILGKGPVPKVVVRGADGIERELVLLRISGKTAYVCSTARYPEAVDNPDLVGGLSGQ